MLPRTVISYLIFKLVVKDGSIILTLKLDNSMEQHLTTFSSKKKVRTIPSTKNMLRSVFWDAERLILIDSLTRKQIVSAIHYMQLLQELQCALHGKCPVKRQIFLEHDSAHPHTVHLGKTEKLGWEVLPRPSVQTRPLLTTTCTIS
jgi:hypothetical protein